MTATIQTIDTPDGAFTILADDRQRVLASGWTADPAAILARLASPPAEAREGQADAAAAARAYYDGDLAAIDDVEVVQTGTALQRAGWAALRTIAPGTRSPMRSSPPPWEAPPPCEPPHPSAPATRPLCSCRATGCCAPVGRSVGSRGGSRSSARC